MQVPYVDIGQQFKDQKHELMPIIERVLESGNYILGEEVEKFEQSFAKLCGVKHAISVANGTDAIILALRALDIGPGDEVITVPNSWISSASAIALVGATPVFVDALQDQTMDPGKIERAITSRTRAILPVHLTGKCAAMGSIRDIAKARKLAIIEDSAQAVGAKYHGECSGSMGMIGCFSLHPLKNLNATGDAGIMTTHDDEIAHRLKLLRHHGLLNRNEVEFFGYNSRLDALQAAILNCRMKYLDEITSVRRKNAAYYRTRLSSYAYCPNDEKNCFDVYHLFVIQTPRRDELKNFLADHGVATAIHYPIPIHLQEAAKKLGYRRGSFPEIERQSAQILSLPVSQCLTEEQRHYTADLIENFFKGQARKA